jgi:hypothetical protein
MDVFPVLGAPSTKIRYEALPSMDPYPKKKERTLIKNYFLSLVNILSLLKARLPIGFWYWEHPKLGKRP